jgi:hypothetical protein
MTLLICGKVQIAALRRGKSPGLLSKWTAGGGLGREEEDTTRTALQRAAPKGTV